MKNHLSKAALAIALGLAGATAAHAQNVDDILLGFTSPDAASVGGTQYDYILDLGNLDTLEAGGAQQINLSDPNGGVTYAYDPTAFTTDLSGAVAAGEAYAGVWGGNPGVDVFRSGNTPIGSPAAANVNNAGDEAYSVALDAVAQTGNSVYENIAESPTQNGAAPNSLGGYIGSPLQSISASVGTGTGYVAEDFNVYESTETFGDPGSGAWTDVGYISVLFGSDGSIAGAAWDVQATPEPATYAIFGGFGLLLFALRRKARSTRSI